MKRIDVVGYSSSNLDVLLKVKRFPGRDDKINGELIGRYPGGTMANYACAASQLGLKSSWTGTIGDDPEGLMVVEGFKNYQVDTSSIRIMSGCSTMLAIIMVDSTGERAIVVVPTIAEPYFLTEMQKKIIAEAKVLYTGPYQSIPFSNVKHWAQQHGTLIAIDVDETSNFSKFNCSEVLDGTDIAIINQSVIPDFIGIDLALEGIYPAVVNELRIALVKHQMQLLGVTLGKKGCILIDKFSACYCPGFKVPVVDTTGAGDVFSAALTLGFLRRWQVADLAVFANASAALSLGKYGPRGHLPTYQEVSTFVDIMKSENRIKVEYF